MEFGPVKFQQGAIGVAEADFAGKSGDFGVVGGNVGGDLDWDVIVEMDTSNYVSTSVLYQYDNNNILYPMAYFAKSIPL
jgi:hypothetical protein